MIPVGEATGVLKTMYEKVMTPHRTVDNVMRAHSLRPHTMEGHLALYKSVLHNPENTLPFWWISCLAAASAPTERPARMATVTGISLRMSRIRFLALSGISGAGRARRSG